MHGLTLHELGRALAERQISSMELTQRLLADIGRAAEPLNAFITVDPERALAAARAADQRRAMGDAAPLLGIPIAHKDIFCARGWRTTCGSRMLEGFVSPYDAGVVESCERAGLVLIGKTNMDEFAMGSSNETSFFGPVHNPWDPARVPGGSSGGSAAAVAARLVPAATGTDTGGSIRQPAALSGITGLKPTYGLVSRFGMIAFASSLDQAGPMATSAEDCALLLDAMAGFDPRDSTAIEYLPDGAANASGEQWRRYQRALAELAAVDRPLADVRIGLPEQYFGPGLSDDVRAAVDAAIDQLGRLGARTKSVSLPNSALSVPAYYVLAPAEASSNLSRFDGVRYGHRAAEYADLMEMYCRSRAEGFGAEVRRRILIGTYVLSHGYYDAYYVKAQKIRRLIADDFARAFRDVDVVLGPTAPSVAFPLAAKSADPVQMYLNDIFTIPANLAGLPALSLPCGFGEGGLPVGLQCVGPVFSEARLLAIAHRYQACTDWHRRMPPRPWM
ncbi:MAG: Asp-tRNA(Asn)/Glu-tRNA(Gln) amidotransferase subunit GatA [Rhodocyclaceae bacterium]|nr:Asp-tRNA(Asn)/Glu-tRNA(Gln) amidotransferase subunit GatA [Rhodocyclaceae bacterium]